MSQPDPLAWVEMGNTGATIHYGDSRLSVMCTADGSLTSFLYRKLGENVFSWDVHNGPAFALGTRYEEMQPIVFHLIQLLEGAMAFGQRNPSLVTRLAMMGFGTAHRVLSGDFGPMLP